MAHRAKCVFELSTGRTGTTSLIEMLQASPSVAAYHEPDPTCSGAAKQAYLSTGDPPEHYLAVFRQARRAYLAKARLQRKVYVEATNMIYLAPLIAKHFPNSKFIYLHRNAADVVRSGMRRGWYQGHANDVNRLTPRASDPAFQEWQEWNAFQRNCWFWTAVNEFILDFKEQIAPERFYTITFDQLIGDDVEPKRKVFSFLGVAPPPDHVIQQALGSNTNAQHKGSFPKFEEWPDQERLIFYETAAKTMKRLGYS